MTQLTKPIRRRTNTTTHTGRSLVVEIRPGATDTVFIREEGRRNGYTVPLAKVYQLGARIEADAKREARKAARKAKAQAKANR